MTEDLLHLSNVVLLPHLGSGSEVLVSPLFSQRKHAAWRVTVFLALSGVNASQQCQRLLNAVHGVDVKMTGADFLDKVRTQHQFLCIGPWNQDTLIPRELQRFARIIETFNFLSGRANRQDVALLVYGTGHSQVLANRQPGQFTHETTELST